ncbi:hypothetical protein FIBSPDRAFT_73802 [Athelia psychrophila]|uniref:Uncharacterized protein n=1 Tax=Athelia psychrophila TaxID=1759441 RepID=A0A166ENB5_9AGAM|nr:hypothetical protein FIBSPDRAFT_73802 [Fibularhizoctonia sp. CBS 109695]
MDRRLRDILVDEFNAKRKKDICADRRGMAKLWKEAGRVKARTAVIHDPLTIPARAYQLKASPGEYHPSSYVQSAHIPRFAPFLPHRAAEARALVDGEHVPVESRTPRCSECTPPRSSSPPSAAPCSASAGPGRRGEAGRRTALRAVRLRGGHPRVQGRPARQDRGRCASS